VTKVFREERERPVIIAVDQCSSMFFGSQVAFKSVIAAQAAALFCWLAIDNGDRVGGWFFQTAMLASSDLSDLDARHSISSIRFLLSIRS
jgi:uncharacterized protein (DUF58 family)